jgi:hypothetical protein
MSNPPVAGAAATSVNESRDKSVSGAAGFGGGVGAAG